MWCSVQYFALLRFTFGTTIRSSWALAEVYKRLNQIWVESWNLPVKVSNKWKFLAGNWNHTYSQLGLVCLFSAGLSLWKRQKKKKKTWLLFVQPAQCGPTFHLPRLRMKTIRDRLPVISAPAWWALINYALQRDVREKIPEKQTSCWLLARSRHCVSHLKWQLIWKRLTPGFPPTSFSFLPCPRPSADWLIKEG